MNQLTSYGLTWNVLDRGHGPDTLVFLPGTLGSAHIFREQVEAFSQRNRVLVFGYPGNSELARMSDSFWNLLHLLGVDATYLVGSSLGAYLLQHFTSESTRGVKGLLLGNTFVDSFRLRFIRMFEPEFIDGATPAEAKRSWLDFVANLKSEVLRSTLLPMVRDEQSDEELHGRSRAIAHLGKVSLSALPPSRIGLLSCADDPVCNAETAAEVAAAYPGARHVRLTAGAHYPHVINADEYNRALGELFPALAGSAR